VYNIVFRKKGRDALIAVVLKISCMAFAPPALAQTVEAPNTAPQALPPFVQRGLPDEFHEALKPLVGKWRATKQIFVALGAPGHPATSNEITTTRSWIGGGRHLLDITQGPIAGGSYYRMAVLSFSTMDHRYEFASFDGMNANSMLYKSVPLEKPVTVITLFGAFTDQGLLGEAFAGKTIPMRTIIRIEGPDRNTIELRFDVPGGQQDMLIERTVYTRIPD
jgi:hypothetical protein